MATYYVDAATGNDLTGDGSSGTPWATPGRACDNTKTTFMVGGDILYIKNGTYALTGSGANVGGGPINPPAGTSAAPTRIIGYNSTTGDLDTVSGIATAWANFPVLAASASGAVPAINSNLSYVYWFNLVANAASQATRAMWFQATNSRATNCRARQSTAYGLNVDGTAILTNCEIDGNATRGLYCAGSTLAEGCVIHGNTGPGAFVDANRTTFLRCRIYANTGASSDGIYIAGSFGPWVRHCSFYGSGRDAIHLNDATSGDLASIHDNVFYGATGKAINSATTNYGSIDADYNAYVSGALSNVPAGAHDVTITGDPYTSSSTGDLTLNNTAGAGAACRGAAGTANADLGAFQTAGTGGSTVYIFGSEG